VNAGPENVRGRVDQRIRRSRDRAALKRGTCFVDAIIGVINTVLWDYLLIYGLLGAGLCSSPSGCAASRSSISAK
jgi:hypothetical protein